jgi:hypothetical protein
MALTGTVLSPPDFVSFTEIIQSRPSEAMMEYKQKATPGPIVFLRSCTPLFVIVRTTNIILLVSSFTNWRFKNM